MLGFWAGSELRDAGCRHIRKGERPPISRQSNSAMVTSPSDVILGRKAKLYSEEMNPI